MGTFTCDGAKKYVTFDVPIHVVECCGFEWGTSRQDRVKCLKAVGFTCEKTSFYRNKVLSEQWS